MDFTIRVVTGHAPDGLDPRPDSDFDGEDVNKERRESEIQRKESEIPTYVAVFLDGVLVWAGVACDFSVCGCVEQIVNEKVVQSK